MSKRGKLTPDIKAASKILFEDGITQEELNLIPYLSDCLINNRLMSIKAITSKQMDIMIKWKSLGFVDYTNTSLRVTKEFWMVITMLLWHAFIDNNNNMKLTNSNKKGD